MIGIYARSDGSIAKQVSCADSVFVMEQIAGCTFYQTEKEVKIDMHYYDSGIQKKTYMTIDAPESGEVGETIEITGIPENCTVSWPDNVRTIETGSVSFDANTQGVYKFVFYHAKHFPKKVFINVT